MHRAVACLLLVAVAIAAPAQAQPTTTDRAKSALEALFDIDQQNADWRARRGVQISDGEKAVRAVSEAIAKRDCISAVSALNAGLAKSYPEVFTLAGAMYEEGVCLKQNWDRAVGLYQRAASANHPGVAARLAAGYATALAGRDKAASLWWAQRAGTAMPVACKQPAAVLDDPDKFVAALKAWPAGQLDNCVYIGAVMATIQAEAEGESSSLATVLGLAGRVNVAFVPGKGAVDIADKLVEGALPIGVMTDTVALQADRRTARKAFVAGLQQRADLALKRYDKPAGLPADWRAEADYEFRASR